MGECQLLIHSYRTKFSILGEKTWGSLRVGKSFSTVVTWRTCSRVTFGSYICCGWGTARTATRRPHFHLALTTIISLGPPLPSDRLAYSDAELPCVREDGHLECILDNSTAVEIVTVAEEEVSATPSTLKFETVPPTATLDWTPLPSRMAIVDKSLYCSFGAIGIVCRRRPASSPSPTLAV